jgi:hypothetical protein
MCSTSRYPPGSADPPTRTRSTLMYEPQQCPAGSSECGYVSGGDDRQDWEHMYWEHRACADCGSKPRDGDSVSHRMGCPRLAPGYRYPAAGRGEKGEGTGG